MAAVRSALSENNGADAQPVTTGPLPSSSKVYRTTESGGRVPFRRIGLSNGEHLDVYDTSGPYTEPAARIDIRRGLQLECLGCAACIDACDAVMDKMTTRAG